MKRTNEFAVGLAVLLALALVVVGALWLSETDVHKTRVNAVARFRTVGGLGVGAPVTLRGVKVGRVEAIRLVENDWVETEFSIDKGVDLPTKPAVISASASLFGEWGAAIISYQPLPTDPNLREALVESDSAGGEAWPGATLPDIGQLTAQASRIAGDVGVVTQRISQAFDSTALKNLQKSV
jgi:ABC-type transporter Mla subunit MlaD